MDALDIRRTSLLWLAVVCLASAIAVQYARDQYLTPTAGDEGLLYVESPSAVKRLALGYDALLADVYWIRTVQYFGGQKLAERARHKHDLVYPLLDIRYVVGRRVDIALEPTHAVLFETDERTVAFGADAVDTFVRVPASKIARSGDEGMQSIAGLTPDGIVVLDSRALLAAARLIVDDRSV